MTMFRDDLILPPPPSTAVPILHNREYRVQSYRLSPDLLLIQGALRDQKPPGIFIPDDPESITVHHMVVELEVSYPELEIVGVRTDFDAFPHESCPVIIDHYEKLIGLSFARGFTHKVRELFGGPRGCSHTTALLQAMAPIAVQSRSGFEIIEAAQTGAPHPFFTDTPRDDEWRRLVNTCHLWREDGERVLGYEAGEPRGQMLQIRRRLAELGRDEQNQG